MIQKENNISLCIPESKTKNGFRMIPIKIFKQINDILNYRKNNININEKIAIENNHQDILKYKYYNEFLDILQKDLYELFNKKLFWELNMDKRVCDFKIKSGKYQGLYCGKRIDIKSMNKDGYYRCSSHISSKYYKPKINVNKSDENNLCIAKTGYKKKFNCNMLKKYGDYCIYHYKEVIKEKDIKSTKYYFDEINLFNNIYVEQSNNCKIISKKEFLKNELKLLFNIDFTYYNSNKHVDIFEVKINNKICLENQCFNKTFYNKDLCYNHFKKQQTIGYRNIINEKTYNYINKNYKEVNKENEIEITKYNCNNLMEILNRFNKNILENTNKFKKIIYDFNISIPKCKYINCKNNRKKYIIYYDYCYEHTNMFF